LLDSSLKISDALVGDDGLGDFVVIRGLVLCVLGLHAAGDFGGAHQRAQDARAAVKLIRIRIAVRYQRRRAGDGERLDLRIKRIPALLVCSRRFGRRYVFGFVFHHGRHYGAFRKVGDIYPPNIGFMKEFIIYDVFSKGRFP